MYLLFGAFGFVFRVDAEQKLGDFADRGTGALSVQQTHIQLQMFPVIVDHAIRGASMIGESGAWVIADVLASLAHMINGPETITDATVRRS